MLLGYAVGSATPVEIPLRHLCVTGQTQEAGKTTALEALLARSGVSAVAFITKRGERSFAGAGLTTLAPFFREQADWKFVSELIDLTMGGKNKILHSFLMKVCRNTHTLAQVLDNVEAARAQAKRGFDESIYQQIHGYLSLVVPQLQRLPPMGTVQLAEGVNVMDLTRYGPELQALCIRSVIDWVHEQAINTVVVIPEAWEFLPEGRGTPVKPAAERLIRKGAALQNYLWIDSQDLGGVWKTVVRACAVFLIGVQREANEIKRTLANIHVAKPKAADVAMLGLGEFYACYGKHAIKTYVQPVWVTEVQAIATARGERAALANPTPIPMHVRDAMNALEAADLRRENEELREQVAALSAQVKLLLAERQRRSEPVEDRSHLKLPKLPKVMAEAVSDALPPPPGTPLRWDLSAIVAVVKAELRKDPVLLKLAMTESKIEVAVEYHTVQEDGTSSLGRTARLLKEGFFDSPTSASKAWNELKRFGFNGASARIYEACDKLVKLGFLTKEGDGYRAVPSMKKNIQAA